MNSASGKEALSHLVSEKFQTFTYSPPLRWHRQLPNCIQVFEITLPANKTHFDCQLGIAFPQIAAIRHHIWTRTPTLDDCLIAGFSWFLCDCISSPALWSLADVVDRPYEFIHFLDEVNAELNTLNHISSVYHSTWFTYQPTNINRMLCHYIMNNPSLGEEERQRLIQEWQSNYLPEPVRNWLHFFKKRAFPSTQGG